MKLKLTKVFYQIRRALRERNPDGSRKWRYIKLKGSSRSSKTMSAIQNFYSFAWNEERKRFSVWRDTKKDCRDTVLFDMKQIFPDMPYYTPGSVKLHETEGRYTFPSGSKIEICGTDDDKKVHGYNGDFLWLNEPYNISKDTFDQLDMRTTEVVIIDLNPIGDHWSDDLEKDPRCLVLHSTFKDNKYCPVEQKKKILSYQPVKMCEAVEEKILIEQDAKAYNLTENPLKLTYEQIKELSRCRENERKNSASAYKWSVYGLGIKAEKPNRIFFWNEISDDEYHAIDAPRYYGVDWGTVDPWGIIEVKHYDGALYLRELNYSSENTIREGLSPTEREQIDDNSEGLVTWLFRKLDIPTGAYILCDTNRPLKIKALFEAGYDSAIAAPKPPGSINDGIDLLNDMPVFFTSSSKNLKYEQENYERKVDRYNKVTDDPEDKDNHLMDPTRYVALFLFLQGIISKK